MASRLSYVDREPVLESLPSFCLRRLLAAPVPNNQPSAIPARPLIRDTYSAAPFCTLLKITRPTIRNSPTIIIRDTHTRHLSNLSSWKGSPSEASLSFSILLIRASKRSLSLVLEAFLASSYSRSKAILVAASSEVDTFAGGGGFCGEVCIQRSLGLRDVVCARDLSRTTARPTTVTKATVTMTAAAIRVLILPPSNRAARLARPGPPGSV